MKQVRKLRLKTLWVYVLCLCMWVSACSGSQVERDVDLRTSRQPLDTWLEQTLIPYLLQQLGHHPRFKGQPVLLVHMKGDLVQARIDDLTHDIRDKIMDALLKEPGLDLAWQPPIQSLNHHQSLEDVSCGDQRKILYYIGIDSGLTKVERKLYVKVRALNLAEKKWVSGFGRSWQGHPTMAQLRALNRDHPDDHLRGLRPLPFSGKQPDILAAYLAHNLSCLLRQGEADDLVVYVEKAAVNTPNIFQTTLNLVGKYLARFREVQVADDPNQANVNVITEIHCIHQSLYQVWVAARHRQGEKYLPGAETEAYVMVDSQRPAPAIGTPLRRPPEPAIPLHQTRIAPSLISSFDLLTPLNQTFCATDTPWINGERRLDPHEHLPSGGCLALEISLSTPAYVFLVGQNADGDLTHIFPSDCPAFRKIDALLLPGKLLRFPPISDPEAGLLKLDESPGMERVYAIAITKPQLANRFAERLEEIEGLCRPGRSFANSLFSGNTWQPHERVQRWQRYLNQLSARYPEKMQWREISFWHDPP